jgi:predicted TIM-barrel fold metal-dependent hydrolase
MTRATNRSGKQLKNCRSRSTCIPPSPPHAVPLDATIQALDADRVLFSVDYSYQSAASAADFLERWQAPQDARQAVAGGNADRLLHLRAGTIR